MKVIYDSRKDIRLAATESAYQGSTAQRGYFREAKDNRKEVDVVANLPREKILCEVKYRNNCHILAGDAIAFLYLLGKSEAEGRSGKI